MKVKMQVRWPAVSHRDPRPPAPAGRQTAAAQRPGTDSSRWTVQPPGGWREGPGMDTAGQEGKDSVSAGTTFYLHPGVQYSERAARNG